MQNNSIENQKSVTDVTEVLRTENIIHCPTKTSNEMKKKDAKNYLFPHLHFSFL